jgi:hypothetical protein
MQIHHLRLVAWLFWKPRVHWGMGLRYPTEVSIWCLVVKAPLVDQLVQTQDTSQHETLTTDHVQAVRPRRSPAADPISYQFYPKSLGVVSPWLSSFELPASTSIPPLQVLAASGAVVRWGTTRSRKMTPKYCRGSKGYLVPSPLLPLFRVQSAAHALARDHAHVPAALSRADPSPAPAADSSPDQVHCPTLGHLACEGPSTHPRDPDFPRLNRMLW